MKLNVLNSNRLDYIQQQNVLSFSETLSSILVMCDRAQIDHGNVSVELDVSDSNSTLVTCTGSQLALDFITNEIRQLKLKGVRLGN
jgi:hypothetical protein